MVAPRKLVALVVLLAAVPFWALSILSASNGGFFENEWGVQMMVLGGAISMVAGAIAEMW